VGQPPVHNLPRNKAIRTRSQPTAARRVIRQASVTWVLPRLRNTKSSHPKPRRSTNIGFKTVRWFARRAERAGTPLAQKRKWPGVGQTPGSEHPQAARRCDCGSGGDESGEKSAMTQAGHFPPGNPVPRQHWRQNQVNHIRLNRTEATRRRNDRHIIDVAHQQ
jgi:hypothetical protein